MENIDGNRANELWQQKLGRSHERNLTGESSAEPWNSNYHSGADPGSPSGFSLTSKTMRKERNVQDTAVFRKIQGCCCFPGRRDTQSYHRSRRIIQTE